MRRFGDGVLGGRLSMVRATSFGLGAWLLLGALSGAASPPSIALSEVAPGVFVYQGPHGEASPENLGSLANVGFVVGDSAVAVVDTGGSLEFGRRLLGAIRKVSDLPIAFVINTHGHPDHVFGNAAFRSLGATFVGHHKLPRAMAERGGFYQANFRRLVGAAFSDSDIVPPTLLVQEPIELDLGNRRLRLEAFPTAHTDSDLGVLDVRTGTFFAGDLLFMVRLPVVDGSLKGWLSVIARLRGATVASVVPGHGPASAPWPDSLVPQARYLNGVLAGVREVIGRGGSIAEAIEVVAQDERAHWLLFEDNHPRNVTTSFTELEWE